MWWKIRGLLHRGSRKRESGRQEGKGSGIPRGLFALSPTDLCIIHLSLPAAHSPFSGQSVKKSAEYWPHKGGKI